MLPSEETTSFTNEDEILKQTTSVDLEAVRTQIHNLILI